MASISNAAGSGLDQTILRCRGEFLIHGIPDAASDVELAGIGLCVVTAQALAVGGTSVPGPIADDESDAWLWHQYIPMDAIGATAAAGDNIGLVHRFTLDAKAMRKLPEDFALILVAELTDASMPTELRGGMRVLLGS